MNMAPSGTNYTWEGIQDAVITGVYLTLPLLRNMTLGIPTYHMGLL